MAKTEFQPYKILDSQLSTLPIKEGQLIITTDTKKIYLDASNNNRILLSENILVSTLVDGLMSKEDKIKLDGIEENANNYSLPTASSTVLGGVKVGTNLSISEGILNATDTTYNVATTSNNGLMSSGDKSKLDGIAEGAQVNSITGVKGNSESSYRTGNINITKANIGLGNVENKNSATIRGELTSSDVTTALTYTPMNNNLKGANGGVAELDSTGKIPSSQLPSYVDDVLEYSSKSNFPTTGETGKIYVDIAANKTYRWGGSAYAEISSSIALGTTSSTAFRGDYGNTAYTHATAKGSAYASGLYKITTNDQGHVTGATEVTKDDITALGIPGQDTNTTYNVATTDTNGLMSSGDKTKLNGIATGANNYSLPTASSSTLGGIKIGTNLSISNGVVSAKDTTYGVATTSNNGLMSSGDKTKLNGIATGANNYSLPAASSSALGGLKVRYDSDTQTLYIRNDSTAA